MLLLLWLIWSALDLSVDSHWELVCKSNDTHYRIGQHIPKMGPERDWARESISGTSDPMAGNETLTALHTEQPGQHGLNREESSLSHVSAAPPLSVPATLIHWATAAEAGVELHCANQNLTCFTSSETGAELRRDGISVGRVGDELKVWSRQLGKPCRLFQHPKMTTVVNVYQASLVDIGLFVEDQRVARVTLMEPGLIEVELLRAGFLTMASQTQ